VDWRRQLRRYAGRILDREPSYQRPNRRLPLLLGIVPGESSQSSKPKVLAAIDTSGSISQQQLEEFDAELERLARHYEVTVAECDARIHAVYRYQPIPARYVPPPGPTGPPGGATVISGIRGIGGTG
jgi:predicted metal-dependent peptidase